MGLSAHGCQFRSYGFNNQVEIAQQSVRPSFELTTLEKPEILAGLLEVQRWFVIKARGGEAHGFAMTRRPPHPEG